MQVSNEYCSHLQKCHSNKLTSTVLYIERERRKNEIYAIDSAVRIIPYRRHSSYTVYVGTTEITVWNELQSDIHIHVHINIYTYIYTAESSFHCFFFCSCQDFLTTYKKYPYQLYIRFMYTVYLHPPMIVIVSACAYCTTCSSTT